MANWPVVLNDGSADQTTGDLFWQTDKKALHILGGETENNGPLLVTRRAKGGDPVLASGISVYRNSQFDSGSPTVNDIVNAEFLLQASDGAWYTCGGVGGKITGIDAGTNAIAGGTIFYYKPAGGTLVDNTLPGMFLGPTATLRIGDGNTATRILEIKDTTNNFVLSAPVLAANETLAVRPQISSTFPGNPTATTSTTDVMMGLGSTIAFTPRQSGALRVTIGMMAANSLATKGVSATMYRGSGSAPTNGAAVTGSQTSGSKIFTATDNGAMTNIVLDAFATGLTVGTAYWFDVALKAVSGGTASILYINCNIQEL
ncbi:MAG TPA: hypothetical protein VMZ90_12730 [Vicinamibacterales bacterium]|nr:hypothetical protein [Vicinamibacterales bacterium]